MYKIFEMKQEDKINRQKCYGHYCNKCRIINIIPIPFYDFTIDFWDKFRKRVNYMNERRIIVEKIKILTEQIKDLEEDLYYVEEDDYIEGQWICNQIQKYKDEIKELNKEIKKY